MKRFCMFLLSASLCSTVSADILKELRCYDEVVTQGVATLILPRQVESLFGATNVDHFISNFGSKTHSAMWNTVTYFAGRYMLTLQVPINIDYSKCELLGAVNSCVVHINEVTSVGISRSGIAEASLRGQWVLNENEWSWLVKNNGDWAAVKIPILTNAPVKHFDEYVRQKREPIRNRRQGFDIPIDNALKNIRNPVGKERGTNR